MMWDLNELLQFLEDRFPGMRIDLCSFQNTGGWRADVKNTFGRGPTPLAAVLDLVDLLNLSEIDVQEWRKEHDD